MAKNEKVVKETTNEKQEAVETKMANEDGKLKVKKKPSMKRVDYTNEPVKVDMSNPPIDETQPKEKEEEVKEKEVKEEETTPVVEEVVEEVKEEVENKEEETEKPVIEEVTEQEVEEKVEEVEEAVEEAVEAAEKTGEELPENIQKVVDFMNETGGDLEDYVKLNQDYSKYDDMSMLREYYKQTKSHLTDDEISFLIEDSFKYDEDVDEERDVKRKKLAFKEQVANAKNHMDGLKSKYYAEIKSGAKLAPEQQKAVDFFNRYNKESKESEKIAEEQRSVFDKQTNMLFNKTFKKFVVFI